MVDEFQDTSRVQLRILKKLAGNHGNIVVVGDDDQSIYRFRGANVANLLDFSRLFPACRTVDLTINYRSHRGIVAGVGRWMDSAAQWEVDGRSFRYAKDIVPYTPDTHADYSAVMSVQGQDPVDEVRQIADLLQFLKNSGVIGEYGQVALLLHSVQDGVSGPYLDGLESAGIQARCEPAGHVQTCADDGVLVTTIHQAKGREWDVVVVGLLCGPDRETDRIGDFDRARQHYVAFTRARHLLVLTASGEPQTRIRSIWEVAARWPDADRDALARQRFGATGTVPRKEVGIDHLDRLVVSLAPPKRVS